MCEHLSAKRCIQSFAGLQQSYPVQFYEDQITSTEPNASIIQMYGGSPGTHIWLRLVPPFAPYIGAACYRKTPSFLHMPQKDPIFFFSHTRMLFTQVTKRSIYCNKKTPLHHNTITQRPTCFILSQLVFCLTFFFFFFFDQSFSPLIFVPEI